MDDMVQYWIQEITKAIDKLAAKKPHNMKKAKKIQFTPEIIEKLRKLEEMINKIDENEEAGQIDKNLIKSHNKHKNHCTKLIKRTIMEKRGISIKPSSSLSEIYKAANDVLRPEQQAANQLKIVKDGIVIYDPKILSDVFGTFFVDKVDDIVEDINSKKRIGPFSCNDCEEKFEFETDIFVVMCMFV